MHRRLFYLYFITFLLICSSCKEEDLSVTKPELTLTPLETYEGNGKGQLVSISLDLSEATTVPVSLTWSTRGKTALENIDFVSVSGKQVIFSPGETRKYLDIEIINDGHMEFRESFEVLIMDAENALIWSESAEVTLLDDDLYQPEMTEDGLITPLNYGGMELFWHDEFNDPGINANYWNYDAANGFPLNCGWGRDELGKYTGDNKHLSLENGSLVMRATRDESGIYRTTRVNTKDKINIDYGRVDIRARITAQEGLATNLWMIGSDMDEVGLPACGEIDIMKHAGRFPESMQYGLVYEDENPAKLRKTLEAPDPASLFSSFHIYTIIWEEDRIRWFLDYIPVFEVKRNEFKAFSLFDKFFFFTINMAVGSEFSGLPDDEAPFEGKLELDYIRVYQRSD